MKKAAISLLAVLTLMGLSACQKTKDDINKATEFDMDYSTEVTVPSSTLALPQGTTQPMDFTTPEIPTQSSSRFSAESTTKDLIEEIKLTKFNISNPSGNLNFLKSISIYIKSSAGEALVATKDNIPENSTSVTADVKDVNIKDHVFKDKIQFRVSVTLITSGSSSAQDQKLKTSQTMHVKGKRI